MVQTMFQTNTVHISTPGSQDLLLSEIVQFLPARRYASAGNSDRNVSVRPSVCPSVTRRYCQNEES